VKTVAAKKPSVAEKLKKLEIQKQKIELREKIRADREKLKSLK